MKSARSKPPGSARKRVNNVNYGSAKDPVQVYCRLRPHSSPPCVRMISDTTLAIAAPDSSTNNLRSNNASKEIRTTFTKIFRPESTQQEIFDAVALPLIDNIVHGRNSLLFTYGVTGSGKTYTMTGEPSDPGIMPRCLDAIFNSVAGHQANKFVFKPDKLNGFDVQTEADAMLDRQNEMHAGFYGQKRNFKPEAVSGANRPGGETRRVQVDQDSLYAVFVTYVEIYNNSVYDLLEEEEENRGVTRPLQSKIIREDGTKNMYVHGVTELEIKTPEEALETFNYGQRRRRVAHTSLNVESSRSHSVFTIRVVQSPLDHRGEEVIQDKRLITTAQLSLVDLAGSERINRTKNTGQRLREAGNINNSLMTLRSCLEILRENQTTNSNKIVPYRDSKLTHLFKNFFDGDGQVKMIVCINPGSEDFDETLHVLKFAEITQEVQTSRPNLAKIDLGLPVGRKEFKNINNNNNNGLIKEPIYGFADFPDFGVKDPMGDDEVLSGLTRFLEQRIEKRETLRKDLKRKMEEFRKSLSGFEREQMDLRIENSSLRAAGVQQRRKLEALEGHLGKTEEQREGLQRRLDKANEVIRGLQAEIRERDLVINQRMIDKQRAKQRYNHKMQAETDKMNRELESKLRSQREQLQSQMKEKEEKLRLVRKILTDEKPDFAEPKGPGGRGPAAAAGNKRYRRSQSADRWIDHRPGAIVPVGTVLQPLMRRRRSVTRLNSPKEITDGASRYCLVAQEVDTDGELETRLFKGDIIPTSGGGAQVVFNDVECLKQASPSARKRSGGAGGGGDPEKKTRRG